jgi:hypothetical protein
MVRTDSSRMAPVTQPADRPTRRNCHSASQAKAPVSCIRTKAKTAASSCASIIVLDTPGRSWICSWAERPVRYAGIVISATMKKTSRLTRRSMSLRRKNDSTNRAMARAVPTVGTWLSSR